MQRRLIVARFDRGAKKSGIAWPFASEDRAQLKFRDRQSGHRKGCQLKNYRIASV
jgi:hypothetical protein